MTKQRTYNLSAAARYMGVSFQAVQQRFGNQYRSDYGNGVYGLHAIPLSALRAWQKERQSRAEKLLAKPARLTAKGA